MNPIKRFVLQIAHRLGVKSNKKILSAVCSNRRIFSTMLLDVIGCEHLFTR